MQAILSRRTIRRFRQERIPLNDLIEIAHAGACAPSAGNRQPWEFIAVNQPAAVEATTDLLQFLGGPADKGQRPTAHIVLLVYNPEGRWPQYADGGAAMQNMILAAWEKGIGACWVGSIDRSALARLLGIPEPSTIFSVLCLGYPDEEPAVEMVDDAPQAKRDESGRLIVQKRRLEKILHLNRYGTPP